MSSEEESTLQVARRHHRQRVNDVLRRPGMYGRDELAEVLLLEAMAAVDGSLTLWRAEHEALRARGASIPTGVRGAYSSFLPADALREATASVYAGIAHRCQWLDLDRALSKAEYHQLAAHIEGWVAEDRTLSQVIDYFGAPSLWIGGTHVMHSKTLAYTTADSDDDLICVHLWNARADAASITEPVGVHPEPVVLAVRHRPGEFTGSLSFTPEGRRRLMTDR